MSLLELMNEECGDTNGIDADALTALLLFACCCC